MEHWILDGITPVATDYATWAKWFSTAERHIALASAPYGNSEISVSTVFLGLGSGPQFETMVFGYGDDELQERHYTYREAVDFHDLVCNRIEAALSFKLPSRILLLAD